MRYYLDTEFVDDGASIELVSIGVVADDGREFYAEHRAVPWHRASEWVLANVRPHLRLPEDERLSSNEIASRLREFIGEDQPEFWSWCSAYDWVAVCQLYGTMMDKPAGWPSYCRDLQQELDRHGLSDDQVPPHPGTAHDALADAHWHRAIHQWLVARC